MRGVTVHLAERRARQSEDRIRALAANPKISVKPLMFEGAAEAIAHGPQPELCTIGIANVIKPYRRDRRSGTLWLRDPLPRVPRHERRTLHSNQPRKHPKPDGNFSMNASGKMLLAKEMPRIITRLGTPK
jgi:hypothetical protein